MADIDEKEEKSQPPKKDNTEEEDVPENFFVDFLEFIDDLDIVDDAEWDGQKKINIAPVSTEKNNDEIKEDKNEVKVDKVEDVKISQPTIVDEKEPTIVDKKEATIDDKKEAKIDDKGPTIEKTTVDKKEPTDKKKRLSENRSSSPEKRDWNKEKNKRPVADVVTIKKRKNRRSPSPFRRNYNYSPPRRHRSPLRRRSPFRRGFSPHRRGRSPFKRNRSPFRRSRSFDRRRRSSDKHSQSPTKPKTDTPTENRRNPQKTQRDLENYKIKCVKDKQKKLLMQRLDSGLVPPGMEMDLEKAREEVPQGDLREKLSRLRSKSRSPNDVREKINAKRKAAEQKALENKTEEPVVDNSKPKEPTPPPAPKKKVSLVLRKTKPLSPCISTFPLAEEHSPTPPPQPPKRILVTSPIRTAPPISIYKIPSEEIAPPPPAIHLSDLSVTDLVRDSSLYKKKKSPSPRSRRRSVSRERKHTRTRSRDRSADRRTRRRSRSRSMRRSRSPRRRDFRGRSGSFRRNRSRSRSRSRGPPRRHGGKTFLEEIAQKLNETRPVHVMAPRVGYPPDPYPAPPAPNIDQEFYMRNTNLNTYPMGHPNVINPNMTVVPITPNLGTPIYNPPPPQIQPPPQPQTPIAPPVVQIINPAPQTVPQTTVQKKKEPAKPPAEKNDKNNIAKLYEQKKISLSDFLSIAANPQAEASKSATLKEQNKVITRCEEALNFLDPGGPKFIGRLSANLTDENTIQSMIKNKSPLLRGTAIKFPFTTQPRKLQPNQKFQAFVNDMLKFCGIVENQDTSQIEDEMEENTKPLLYATGKCEKCELRESTLYLNKSVQCSGTMMMDVGVQTEDNTKKKSLASLTPAQLLQKQDNPLPPQRQGPPPQQRQVPPPPQRQVPPPPPHSKHFQSFARKNHPQWNPPPPPAYRRY